MNRFLSRGPFEKERIVIMMKSFCYSNRLVSLPIVVPLELKLLTTFGFSKKKNETDITTKVFTIKRDHEICKQTERSFVKTRFYILKIYIQSKAMEQNTLMISMICCRPYLFQFDKTCLYLLQYFCDFCTSGINFFQM